MDFAPGRRPIAEPLESRVLCSAAQLVRNGGFERTVADADWVRTGAFQADSRFTSPRSGAGYAYLATPTGTAGDNLAGSLSQQLTIPSTASSLTLNFFTRITTSETTTSAANDVFTVKVFDASGTTELQTLGTLSNLNASSGYVPRTYALDRSLIGQSVRLVFAANTNASLPTTFRVDDVGLLAVSPEQSNRVVGYLPQYRFTSSNKLDLSALTHVNYFSVTANANGSLATTGVNDANLAAFVSAAHAAGVTVGITIGPQSFATIASSATARAAFAQNIVNYARQRNLDGIDIDWEPPATGTNVANYGLLIEAVYAAAHPQHMLLTAAVNPIRYEIPLSAVPEMDWINIMGYDFAPANHSTYTASTNALVGWRNYGVPANKLVLGVPFYGREGVDWATNTSSTYGAIAAATLAATGAMPAPDADLAPNGYYYNGVRTMQRKVEYVRDNGYGGAMIWELGQDYWNGSSNYTVHSLMPVIKSVLRASPVIGAVTASPANNAVAPLGKTQNVSVTVTIDAPSAGVLQVALVGKNASVPRDWFYVGAAGPVTRTFTLPVSQTTAGAQLYEIYTQFRPGAAAGPLVDIADQDALKLVAHTLNWQAFPEAPTTPNPGDGAVLVAGVPSVLDWADAPFATSYDVYVNGVLRQTVTASQWTRNVALAANVEHTWQVVAKNQYGTAGGPVWRFTYTDAPGAPVNVSPGNDAGEVGVTPTLSAGSFSDPNAGDTHSASQWVVRRASDGAVVFDSGADAANKTSVTLEASLEYATKYTWQVRYRDANGAWGAYSVPTAFTTIEPPDTTAPAMQQAMHDVDGRAVAVTFSEPVGAVVGDAFVEIDGQAPVNIGPGAASADVVTYTLPASLADGNYVLRVPAGSVRDAAGNATAADATYGFYVLAGDANRDRLVDFNDLVVVAQSYGATSGKTFSQGDFNYDGAVDFNDLVVIAQGYGGSLAAPPPVAPVPAAAVASEPSVAKGTAAGDVFSTTPIARAKPVAKVTRR